MAKPFREVYHFAPPDSLLILVAQNVHTENTNRDGLASSAWRNVSLPFRRGFSHGPYHMQTFYSSTCAGIFFDPQIFQ
jgi:hypothetical protein